MNENPAEFNKVTMTFEFAPDKWMGLRDFQKHTELLEILAVELGLNQGRSRTEVKRELVGMGDE